MSDEKNPPQKIDDADLEKAQGGMSTSRPAQQTLQSLSNVLNVVSDRQPGLDPKAR